MSGCELAFYKSIESALVQSSGVMTDEVLGQLALVDLGVGLKADPIVGLIKEAEAEQERWKKEAAEYNALARAAGNRADALKAWLLTRMDSEQKELIDGPRHKVRLMDSPPSVEWPEDQGPIPFLYQRVKVELNKSLAAAAYKAGQLPAGFVVRIGKHLKIT